MVLARQHAYFDPKRESEKLCSRYTTETVYQVCAATTASSPQTEHSSDITRPTRGRSLRSSIGQKNVEPKKRYTLPMGQVRSPEVRSIAHVRSYPHRNTRHAPFAGVDRYISPGAFPVRKRGVLRLRLTLNFLRLLT